MKTSNRLFGKEGVQCVKSEEYKDSNEIEVLRTLKKMKFGKTHEIAGITP